MLCCCALRCQTEGLQQHVHGCQAFLDVYGTCDCLCRHCGCHGTKRTAFLQLECRGLFRSLDLGNLDRYPLLHYQIFVPCFMHWGSCHPLLSIFWNVVLSQTSGSWYLMLGILRKHCRIMIIVDKLVTLRRTLRITLFLLKSLDGIQKNVGEASHCWGFIISEIWLWIKTR